MAITRQKKEDVVQDYADKLSKAKSLVFTNYEGLSVKEIEDLRKQCREQGIDYVVAKKSLIKLALEKAGITDVNPRTFDRSVASVFGYEDEVAPAKIIGEYSKDNEAVKPVGGILEEKFIDAAMVMSLSKLPSKPELLAKAVGSIKAPISGFVGALSGNLRNLVGVLNAIKDTK